MLYLLMVVNMNIDDRDAMDINVDRILSCSNS